MSTAALVTWAIADAVHATKNAATASGATSVAEACARIANGDGRRTVAITGLDHRSRPFHSGASAHLSPVRTPSIAMRCTPAASGASPSTMRPSIDVAACTSGPTSMRSTPSRVVDANPATCTAVVAPGGRSSGCGQLSLGGGRLKNHAGNAAMSA